MNKPTDKTTRINGFLIELDFDIEDGELRSQCTVSKGDCGASLECAMNFGEIDSINDDQVITIANSTLDKIEKWALANEY